MCDANDSVLFICQVKNPPSLNSPIFFQEASCFQLSMEWTPLKKADTVEDGWTVGLSFASHCCECDRKRRSRASPSLRLSVLQRKIDWL